MEKKLQFFLATTSNRYNIRPHDMKPFGGKTFQDIIDKVNERMEAVLHEDVRDRLHKFDLYGHDLSNIRHNNNVIRQIREILLDIGAFANDGHAELKQFLSDRVKTSSITGVAPPLLIFYLMNHGMNHGDESIKKRLEDDYFANNPRITAPFAAKDDINIVEVLYTYTYGENHRLIYDNPNYIVGMILANRFNQDIPASSYFLAVKGYKEKLPTLISDEQLRAVVTVDDMTHQIVELNEQALLGKISSDKLCEVSVQIQKEVNVKTNSMENQKNRFIEENIEAITNEVSESAKSLLQMPKDAVRQAINVWVRENIYPSEYHVVMDNKKYIKKRFDGNLVVTVEGEEGLQILRPSSARTFLSECACRPIAITQVEMFKGKLCLSHRDISQF